MPRLPRPRRPNAPDPSRGRSAIGEKPGGLRGWWFNRSLAFRRRTALVALILAVYAVVRFVALPGVPCELSPAEECPPSDNAIALVPASAFAYGHANLDPDSSQFEKAEDLAGRLPNFDLIAQGTLQALDLAPNLDLRRDLASWLGEEAAFAEVQAPSGRPSPLFIGELEDRESAEAFLERVAGGSGRPREASYRDVEVRRYGSGLASADLDGFLVLGSPLAVRAAIDTGPGPGEPLSSVDDADEIRGKLPEQRLADAYVSADGVARLQARRGGFAAQLDTFTDYGASRGFAAALVAADDGLELKVESALDRAKVKAAPGFFNAFPPFEPELAAEVAPDALVYLGVAGPGRAIRQLLDQANAAAPGLVDAFERFNRTLRRRGGGDLVRDVLPVLGGEAGFAIVPSRPVPYVSFVFDDVDEERAREQIAGLQGPIIAALNPAQTGQAPTFGQQTIDGTVVRDVRLSQTLHLAYAVFDGKLVVSTNPRGVRQAIEGGDDLAGEESFETVTSGASDGVAALVFLNLEGLIRRAEPLGLNQIVRGFSADVAKLKALGLTVESDEESLQTTLKLEIE